MYNAQQFTEATTDILLNNLERMKSAPPEERSTWLDNAKSALILWSDLTHQMSESDRAPIRAELSRLIGRLEAAV